MRHPAYEFRKVSRRHVREVHRHNASGQLASFSIPDNRPHHMSRLQIDRPWSGNLRREAGGEDALDDSHCPVGETVAGVEVLVKLLRLF